LREAHSGRKKNIPLSELDSEDGFRRQGAHATCRDSMVRAISQDRLSIPETVAIAQRYVDGEITIDELTAAIEVRSTDVS
jgi:hypothetical protein